MTKARPCLAGLSRMLTPGIPGRGNNDQRSDERRALHLLQRAPVDLVLLDIRMPEIDGLDVLEADAKGMIPLLTVVMMTGHGSIEMAVEAMKRGAYDFITKPFDKPVIDPGRYANGLERNRLLQGKPAFNSSR